MRNLKSPTVISGSSHTNSKSTILFINGFKFKNIKRFYHIILHDTVTVRAFHGHFIEEKYAYVSHGKVLLCAIPIDRKLKPNKNVKIFTFELTSENPQIINIPAGFANGMRALQKNSEIIFFSTLSLSDSLNDDYRFPEDYWGMELWKKK